MTTMVCPMCATEFDPSENPACGTCPIGSGCRLACCPQCGYTTVDPTASHLAGWMSRAFKRRRRHRRRHLGSGLEAVTPGGQVRVANLGRLPRGKRRRLEAMGLVVGEKIEVLAQSPVTVVRAGHAQLAIAAELSRLIDVEPARPS
jgi:Fe2+ transport system protein FeoA